MKKIIVLLAFVSFAFSASAQGAKIEFVAQDNTKITEPFIEILIVDCGLLNLKIRAISH